MQYLEVKRHIIDRKYFLGYSFIFFISFILGYLEYISTDINFTFSFLLGTAVFWLSIILIGIIVINIYRCRSFYNSFKNDLNGKTTQLYKIVIETKGYKMKVPYKSYDAEILSMPKSENTICIETDEYLLLFFSISFLGLFQEVLKPYIFLKTDKNFCMKDKKVNIVRDFETVETVQSRTIIFPNKYGIKKVIIPR